MYFSGSLATQPAINDLDELDEDYCIIVDGDKVVVI